MLSEGCVTKQCSAAWEKLPEEKREGKFPIGVLYQVEGRKEYTEAYDELIAMAQGGK